MAVLEKIIHYLNQILIWIAGCFVGAMVIMVCANVFFRIVWKPVPGTFELLGYFCAVAMAFSLGYTQVRRGHIAVDILVPRFSKKIQWVLNAVNNVICMVFFGVVSWQVSKYATTLMRTGEVTETLRIIYYPFTYGVALGCAVLSLVFLAELIKSALKKEEKEK